MAVSRVGLGIVGTVLVAFAGPSPRLVAQTEGASYARIALLQPHDGDTVDFEAGYIRHLAWHKQANDRWVWFGWTVTFGDRQRWFVYATFGHAAADFDGAVSPGEDERDNIANVTPHASFVGNAVYEYLPALSRGNGVPHPTARLELMSMDLQLGGTKAFETALAASQSTLPAETLWYRRVAGGTLPHYVRLRPRSTLKAVLDRETDQPLPDVVHGLITKTTAEILTLRPTMSLGLEMERER